MNKRSLLLFTWATLVCITIPTTTETKQLEKTSKTLRLGIYQHFRGNLYQVLGFARHSETLEELVVYQALYNDYGIWVRPISMFTEKVMHNGRLIPRFSYIGEGRTALPKIRL